MKVLIALALNLTWCAFAGSQCVIILASRPSSRNAKITVLLDGKPQGNAKLIVNLPMGQGSRSLATDSRGIAMLKDLPAGTSCITVTAENNLSSGLCLEVFAQSLGQISSFQMHLVPPRPNPFDEKVKRGEQLRPSLRLRKLAGIVFDPAGGVVPKAEIQIYKRGFYPLEPAMTVKTDDDGKFSASLDPGMYTVVVRRLGFQPEFHGVEISPAGKDDELRQILQLKPTDTCDDAI